MLSSNINILSNFNIKELYILLYLVVINLLAFVSFGIDKNRAKNKKSRIPENILFLFCIVGGSLGGIMAMVIFHHKISKKIFYIGIPFLIILNKVIEILILNYIRA